MSIRFTHALGLSLPLACASEPSPTARGPHHDHRAHSGSHRFEDAEEWAKTFDDPARDRWQKPDEVVALMSIEPGMVVADLGAGTGYFLARLSRAVGPEGRVIGLDVEPGMVDYMTDRAGREGLTNVSSKQVPFDDPGLEAESVDRVLVVDTWHHINDRVAYSRKLSRVLRPGGQLVVVDFTMEAERGPPAPHRITPEQLRAELAAAGLEVELEQEELPDQYVVVGTKPLSKGE